MKNLVRFAVAAAIVILAFWNPTPAAARFGMTCTTPPYVECGSSCTAPSNRICCFSGEPIPCACDNGAYKCNIP
jgi:hypothetical protein